MQARSVMKGRRITGIAMTCSFGVLMGSQPARAGLTAEATASVEYDYYSNVFNQPAAPQNGGGSDESVGYTATGRVGYSDGPSSIDLNAMGRHVDYQHFDLLSHDEVTAGAVGRWKPGDVFDVSASYTYARQMVPFADVLVTQLVIRTDRNGQLTANFMITPVWRLGLTPQLHDLHTPLPAAPTNVGVVPAFPDFRLREKIGTVTLDYLGLSHITTGLAFTHNEGTFSGIAAATKYRQIQGGLTATYKTTDLANFDGELGYTQRDTNPNPDGSVVLQPGEVAPGQDYVGAIGRQGATTGHIAYNRAFTPKTNASFRAFRELVSFAAGANSTIGTGVQVTGAWHPDFRFDITSNLLVEKETFQGAVLAGGNAGLLMGRSDTLRTATLTVNYNAATWLVVGTRVGYENRTSNFAAAAYSSWTAAILVTGALR